MAPNEQSQPSTAGHASPSASTESSFALDDAQEFLRSRQLDGWLLEDFHYNNPIFWQVVGGQRHSTRRAFLLVPPVGVPRLLLHFVDAGRFADLGWNVETYVNRAQQDEKLGRLLAGRRRVAMEYSPNCALPVVSRVDAGTIEQIRGFGVDVVSSADLFQFAVSRWSPAQAESHRRAAALVVDVAIEAFRFIANQRGADVGEVQTRDFILDRFGALGLKTADPPDVATNAHSSDPHYTPSPESPRPIEDGDWVLIDLWAKQDVPRSIYGDTTWVGYVGDKVPSRHQEVFDVVRRSRDAALQLLSDSWRQGRSLKGWEVDREARTVIDQAGYGTYFSHRLGHSIGEVVHGSGVNLDGFESLDTREIIPGVGFSVEPGIYLPDFGVRLEVDVYVDPTAGPIVTTRPQESVVLIR